MNSLVYTIYAIAVVIFATAWSYRDDGEGSRSWSSGGSNWSTGTYHK